MYCTASHPKPHPVPAVLVQTSEGVALKCILHIPPRSSTDRGEFVQPDLVVPPQIARYCKLLSVAESVAES